MYMSEEQIYDYRIQKTLSVTEYTEKGTLVVEIAGNKPISAHGSPTNGIVLPAGGHYEIDVNFVSDHSDIFLFYNQLFYYVDNGTVLKPRTLEPYPDGSLYYGYQGNNHEYMWTLPYGEPGGRMVLDAPSGRDVVINRLIVRGFHGILNSTGDTGGGDVGLGDDLNNGGKL